MLSPDEQVGPNISAYVSGRKIGTVIRKEEQIQTL
jgi:hypothetical protein